MSTKKRWLEIGSLVLAVPGCCEIEELGSLIGGSAVRGDNRIINVQPGRRAYEPVVDETETSVRLFIYGANDFTGSPHADQWDGIYANLATLHAGVLARPGGDGTRTATLHWNTETELTKPVQVIPPMGLAWEQGAPMYRAVLNLRFPEGLFDLSGAAPP